MTNIWYMMPQQQLNNWEDCMQSLQAYKQEQKNIWGNIDDLIIGRYIVNECSAKEKIMVEEAMIVYPQLAICIDFIKKII